jgi:hypothetical protein
VRTFRNSWFANQRPTQLVMLPQGKPQSLLRKCDHAHVRLPVAPIQGKRHLRLQPRRLHFIMYEHNIHPRPAKERIFHACCINMTTVELDSAACAVPERGVNNSCPPQPGGSRVRAGAGLRGRGSWPTTARPTRHVAPGKRLRGHRRSSHR